MFNTPIEFAKEAIRSKRNPRENVCVAATATCGPPGHPCETCMHLKGLSTNRRTDDKDLCLIAPRSLVKPVHYKRYFNRGVAVPPYLPTSKVSGQLKEVEVADPCTPQQITNQILEHQQREMDLKFKDFDDSNTPYLVSHNVYIEHNGRFTKAPKHLLQLGDYSTRVCYLEDIGGPEFNTPLDLALFTQQVFSYLAKALVGMLAGLALVELCILMKLIPSVEGDLTEFFRVYSKIASSFFTLSSVFTIVTLLALFDWMDLAHMNLQHLWDTYLHRTIWIVLLPFFVAFILRKMNGEIDDAIYLHGDSKSQFRVHAADSSISDDLEFRKMLYRWQVRLLCSDAMIIIGWCLLVITRNDDLFFLHLECMKKYDVNTGRRAHKDEVNNPHLYLGAP